MIEKKIIGLGLLFCLVFSACKETEKIVNRTDSDSVSAEKARAIKPTVPKATVPTQKKADSLTAAEMAMIEGKFTAKTCEDGRFSIMLESKGNRIGYKIFDKKKVFASGKANIYKTDKSNEFNLSIGAMGGILKGDTLTIQNYGNSMNQFDHFGQCADKYLNFVK